MAKMDDRGSWAIGGGVIGGVGVGLLLHYYNPMAIPGFTLLGLGLGLVIASIISKDKRKK
jgi:hypothetical protein